MSLTISQIIGFLTRHNCNPFDRQWSYSLDLLDGYLQVSYLFTLLLLVLIKCVLSMLHCKYKILTCLRLSEESKFVIPRHTFVMLEDLINFTLTLLIRG